MLTDKELAGLVQAARLYYEDGLTQAQVAAKIGVSRPQVSKMLAHAREAGIVHIEIRPPVAGDAELLKLLQQRFALKAALYCRRHSAKRSCVKPRNIWRANCATKKT